MCALRSVAELCGIDEDEDELNLGFNYCPIPYSIFEAKVVSVLNFQNIIIQPEFCAIATKETQRQYFDLVNNINKSAMLQPIMPKVTEGKACIAFHLRDKKWFRGEIYWICTKTGEIRVLFVDSGSLEIVKREHIRLMRPEWLQYPVLMAKCTIYGLQVVDDVDVYLAISKLAEMILQKRCLCVVQKLHPELEADLFNPETRDLAYKNLIDEEYFTYEE